VTLLLKLIKAPLLWITLLLAGLAVAETPLRPEKAFQYEVTANANDIIVSWSIEPGYYLYKKRMSFATESTGVTLQKPVYPAGETHEDEFFGKSEVYRDQADIRIPYSGSGPITLIINSQGCADMGLCYPPQAWTAEVDLPGNSSGNNGLPSFIKPAASASGLGGDQPLPAEQAFVVSERAIDAFTAELRWDIADGYYIYKDQIKLRALNNDIQAGIPVLPEGTLVDDIEYGMTQVYYGEVIAKLPLSRATPDATTLELELEFQGCKKGSICYPPQKSVHLINLPQGSASDAVAIDLPESEQGRLASMIANGNILTVMSVFLGLGLLLAFTPCVLPMVPILSGIIAGQGKDITAARGFALSLTYVLGMALTYTLAGVLFAAAGQQVQAALQQPAIIIGVTLLFLILAAAMFGFFTLQMPAALQTRINALSGAQQTGTFIGTAVMGALSALVVTTCVAPPLVATLTVIAETGDVVRGGSALFALSIGMGLPLLVIGTSAGKLIPKAGAWMDTVTELFGFMMLGLAIWMLERLLPGNITMLLWGSLLLAFAVRAFMRLAGIAKIALSAIALVYGCVILAAAYQGGTNPLQAIAVISGEQQKHLEFVRIKTVADLEAQLEQAAANGQTTMLDFYADWCVSCKEMEHYTFTDTVVQESLSDTVLLQADVTANDKDDQALLQAMGIFGPPTIIFFDSNGEEVAGQRVIGFQSAEVFNEHLATALR